MNQIENTFLGPNERDLIVMFHQIGITWPKQGKETRNVSLVVYGLPNQGKAGLAMSRTVGIPVGIAASMMINGNLIRLYTHNK